ncbi:MAG: hypothetical protein L3K15_05685, partial [Thermoplasmata archaeon]|nr:hypothetical protein [Thermoplasmata archaeon]
MAYDARDKYVVLFGGFGASVFGDTWSFSAGIWTQLHPASHPSARYGAVMAFDAKDNYAVLYG